MQFFPSLLLHAHCTWGFFITLTSTTQQLFVMIVIIKKVTLFSRSSGSKIIVVYLFIRALKCRDIKQLQSLIIVRNESYFNVTQKAPNEFQFCCDWNLISKVCLLRLLIHSPSRTYMMFTFHEWNKKHQIMILLTCEIKKNLKIVIGGGGERKRRKKWNPRKEFAM